MTQKQQDVLIGMILGDAYLQSTGKQNARLRLEHSVDQKEYILWKMSWFPSYFQNKVRFLDRANLEFGNYRRIFYKNSQKIIPENVNTLLKSPLSLAVWHMDDGYYYHRDRMSYIYISNFGKDSIKYLLETLKENFTLFPVLKEKKKGLVLVFNVIETMKLIGLIRKYIIPSMMHKVPLDPVSTDQKSDVSQMSSEIVI